MQNSAVFVNAATPAVISGSAADTATINPAQRSAASSAMMPRILNMRACYGGTETMRQMGETFLPRFRRESKERWQDRLDQTACTNKLREAVDSASAKPFRNLVSLKNAPESLNNWAWNADGCGRHLHIIGHRFFNEAVLTGIGYILVDHPTTTTLPNLKAQREENPQPFLRQIRAEDMLGAYYEKVKGEYSCVHARISSSRTQFNRNTFSEQVIDQVYVIEPGIVQVWERARTNAFQVPPMLADGGSIATAYPIDVRYQPYGIGVASGAAWELVSEYTQDLDRVPLVHMVAGDEEANMVVRPVFQDLAYKQQEHWRSTSEQRNILSSARFPMLASSGVEIDENGPEGEGFEVGPWVVLTSPDPQGRWYFVEPKGNAIEAGAKDIASIEYQMDMMALNPVQATNRQYVPQNERSLAETRVNSVVHDLAIGCQDALQKAVCYAGMWTGEDYSKVGVNLNFNFSGTDELAGKIGSVLDAVAKGVLSREGALNELVRLNLLTEDFDIKSELARASAQAEMQLRTAIDNQPGGSGRGAADPAKPPKSERDFPAGQTRPTAQH